MRQPMMLAVVCGALAIVCLAAGALFFAERPTVLTVAVPAQHRGDYDLIAAAERVVRHGHHPIRFKVVSVVDSAAAAAKIDDGSFDMAVVRTDEAMPAQGQTVVILHRDAAVLVAAGPSELKEVSDLPGHTVGILGEYGANRALLDTVLAQSDVPSDAVKSLPLTPSTVATSLKDKTIDAVLVVGIVASSAVQDTVKTVAQAGEGSPAFIPVSEAAAIAQRSPAYDSLEIVKGAFRGAPPRPADDYDTVSVTHRLVARSTLSQTVVADVTRFFLQERSALVAVDTLARSMEEPSTDKGTALPAHPGTAAYIDDEEESFLDQYSDFIYLGAMFFGVIASGGTAMFSRLNAQGARAVERLTARLIEILKLARFAPSIDMVNGLEAETDEIVAAALEESTARSLDERRLGALGLALHQVREAIRDRRSMLGVEPHAVAQRGTISQGVGAD